MGPLSHPRLSTVRGKPALGQGAAGGGGGVCKSCSQRTGACSLFSTKTRMGNSWEQEGRTRNVQMEQTGLALCPSFLGQLRSLVWHQSSLSCHSREGLVGR